MLLQQKNEFFVKRHSAVVLFLHCASLALRARRRQRGRNCFLAYPAFTPAARVARLGPCWANLSSRLTALHLRGWRIFFSFEVKR